MTAVGERGTMIKHTNDVILLCFFRQVMSMTSCTQRGHSGKGGQQCGQFTPQDWGDGI